MYTDYEIRQLPLALARYRQKVETFLVQNGLRLDDVDYYAGVFRIDSDDLLAGGGLAGNVIKCIAVSNSLRDEGMSNRLVSHLISIANERGFKNVKLFTKPENRAIFESLSFRLLAEAPKAILMETGTGGLDTYLDYLRSKSNRFEEYGKTLSHPYTGVVVMNANPFTKGHYYLLRQASMQVDTLYVIVVKEDRSTFSYAERKAMIEAGTADLQNVKVLEGSDYAISAATFPTYFLKQLSDASDTQMTLDLDLFSRHIAPALGATIRFVGSEPTDPLTARYNQLMHQLLCPRIEVVEIQRLQHNGTPVCATTLRQHLQQGHFLACLPIAHHATLPYLIAHLATRALQCELDLTPKPGLIDQHDNGAHSDMDYSLMQRSIATLHPYFVSLATLGFQSTPPDITSIRAIGLQAEQAMLQATDGINTHKGALFSLGLAVVAAAQCTFASRLSPTALQQSIASLAAQFAPTSGTHGSKVLQHQHNIKGALANAQDGYSLLFSHWLPFLAQSLPSPDALHRTLLLIISQIDDTNILYRSNPSTAQWAKQQALHLLNNLSSTNLIDTNDLNNLNDQFIQKNISPGGAADMLSLTIFIHSLLYH